MPNALFHPWISNRDDDDYWVMLAHHVVATLLCVGAVVGHWPEWGLGTILTHDIADLPLDLLLVVKDLNAPNATAALFGCTLLCWTGLRCMYYPLIIVRSALRSSSDCDDLGCIAACAGLLLIFAADAFWLVKLLRVGGRQLQEMRATPSPARACATTRPILVPPPGPATRTLTASRPSRRRAASRG